MTRAQSADLATKSGVCGCHRPFDSLGLWYFFVFHISGICCIEQTVAAGNFISLSNSKYFQIKRQYWSWKYQEAIWIPQSDSTVFVLTSNHCVLALWNVKRRSVHRTVFCHLTPFWLCTIYLSHRNRLCILFPAILLSSSDDVCPVS